MTVSVMRKVGTDPQKIRDGLASESFEGVIGPYKSDSTGNRWHQDAIAEFMPDASMTVVHRSTAQTN